MHFLDTYIFPFIQAIERGIQFEVSYSPALKDSTVKKNLIANVMHLVRASKGKVGTNI